MDLPDEILLQIFSAFTSAVDILRLSCVCHRFRYIVGFLSDLTLSAHTFTAEHVSEILHHFPNLRSLTFFAVPESQVCEPISLSL